MSGDLLASDLDGGAWISPRFDASRLSLIEDASINASAPREQRWLDGWLIRTCPGKAKRARCVNAVAVGRLPAADKLEMARQVYREAGLPLFVRVTPFSQPAGLDALLADRGMPLVDDTRVMVLESLAALEGLPAAAALPAGCRIEPVSATAYAQLVGAWRESPRSQIEAHAERVAAAPLPYQALVLRLADGTPACGGQSVREGEFVGLYDIFTASAARGRGLARALCLALLRHASSEGARTAYLQVEASNRPARRLYQQLGFADGYRYRYRAESAGAH